MNHTVIVDTDILTDFMRGKDEAMNSLQKIEQETSASISVITQMELFIGCCNKKELRDIEKFLSRFRIVGLNEEISGDSGSNRLTMSSLPGFGLFFSIFFYNNINPCGFFLSRCQTRINGFDPLSFFNHKGHKDHNKMKALHKFGSESALPSAKYNFNGELV